MQGRSAAGAGEVLRGLGWLSGRSLKGWNADLADFADPADYFLPFSFLAFCLSSFWGNTPAIHARIAKQQAVAVTPPKKKERQLAFEGRKPFEKAKINPRDLRNPLNPRSSVFSRTVFGPSPGAQTGTVAERHARWTNSHTARA
jgi:hypothetical protein